jgi:hypothetical protein
MKEERLYQVCQTQTVSGKGLAEALRRRAAWRRAEARGRRPARPLPIRDALHTI